MKPIPYRNSSLFTNISLYENNLMFRRIRNAYVNQAQALEINRDREPAYLNPARLTTKFNFRGKMISLLDFILHNTLDPDYSDQTGGTAQIDANLFDVRFAGRGSFRNAFNQKFRLRDENQLPANLNEVIDNWSQRFEGNAEKQRKLEIELLQPTNISVLTYKFQTPGFSFNGGNLWELLSSQNSQARTNSFLADPSFAVHVLNCISACEPDTLLISVLTNISDDLERKDDEDAYAKARREYACKTLSEVCDILINYSNRSSAATDVSTSAAELTNDQSPVGGLSGLKGVPANFLKNFNKLSGAEKAFGILGTLILGRALGNNIPPKIRAVFKTMMIAGIVTPVATHLGTKLVYGRSYLETRKIQNLLGGNNSKNASRVVAQICGFDANEAKLANTQENVEGFIDSLVKHDSFSGLKFRDVINGFKPGGNSRNLILGSISSEPDVVRGLTLVIPKLIEKYESPDTDYESRVRFHHLLGSEKTWLEGMYLLMRNSAELEELLNSNSAREEINDTVTRDEIPTVGVTDKNKPLHQHPEHTQQLDSHIEGEDKNYMLRMQIESLENLPVNHPYSSLFAVNVNKSTTAELKSSVDVTGARYVSFELNIQGKNASEVEALLTAARDRVQAIYPDSNKWNRTLVFSGTNRSGTKLFIGYSVAFEYTEAQLSGSERFRKHINSNLKSLISDRYPHPYGLIYRDLFENIPLSQQFNTILSGNATLAEMNAVLPTRAKLNEAQRNLLNNLLNYSNTLGLLDSTKGMISKLLEFNPRRFVSILTDPNTSTLGKINAIASAIRTSSESHTNVLKERTKIYEEFDAAGKEYLRTLTLSPVQRRLLATQFRFAAVLFTLKKHGVENFNMTTLFGSEYQLTAAGFKQYLAVYAAAYKSDSASPVSRVISTTPVPAPTPTPSNPTPTPSTPTPTPTPTPNRTVNERSYRLITSDTAAQGKNYIKVVKRSTTLRQKLAANFVEVKPRPTGADSRYTYYRRITAATPQAGTSSNPAKPATQPAQSASTSPGSSAANPETLRVNGSFTNLSPGKFYTFGNINPNTIHALTRRYKINNQTTQNGITVFKVTKII